LIESSLDDIRHILKYWWEYCIFLPSLFYYEIEQSKRVAGLVSPRFRKGFRIFDLINDQLRAIFIRLSWSFCYSCCFFHQISGKRWDLQRKSESIFTWRDNFQVSSAWNSKRYYSFSQTLWNDSLDQKQVFLRGIKTLLALAAWDSILGQRIRSIKSDVDILWIRLSIHLRWWWIFSKGLRRGCIESLWDWKCEMLWDTEICYSCLRE